jgi:tryptophanyl-tRNA synthetase
MAADILAFDTDVVPVGRDQKQHLEIAQEAARKFNLRYGETLRVPEAQMDEAVMSVPGIDREGRKMSKSYDNTLSPFTPRKALEKRIKAMETDSTEFGAPLPTEGDRILALHQLVAPPEATAALTAKYRSGRQDPSRPDTDFDDPTRNYFGWGHAKKALVEAIEGRFAGHRARYDALMADRGALDALLRQGAEKARAVAGPVLDRVGRASGLSPMR